MYFSRVISFLTDLGAFLHSSSKSTACSSSHYNGVDKQTVAELAGHGDTGFLERTYCHPQMRLKQDAANQLTHSLFDTPGSCANGTAV